MIKDNFIESLTPQMRQRFAQYIETLRVSKLETLAVASDEIQVRRAQGATSAYKDLVKTFTEYEVR